MALYTGETCLICNNIFNENDDVVACPECGTPYHRKCYMEKKHCVNEALHAVHGSWMAESFNKTVSEKNDTHICAKCGCPNSSDAQSCRMCGSLLEERETGSNSYQNINGIFPDAPEIDEYFGFDANETMDSDNSITLGEMADYVKSNKFFYMLSFKRLKDAASKVSVNLIAFLFPDLFFASRKMYGWAALAFAAGFLLGIPARLFRISNYPLTGITMDAALIGQITEFFKAHPVNERLVELCRYLYIAFRVVAGLAANALYYRHIISRLKKIRLSASSYDVYRLRVRTEGGVSFISMLVLFLIQCFALIVMGVVIFILIFY